MLRKFVPTAFLLGCLLPVSAAPLLSEFENGRVTFSQSGGMDLDDGSGSLSISRFDIRALLTKPLQPLDALTVIPIVEYRFSDLNFDDIASTAPIQDQELHSLSLSSIAFYNRPDSPWVYAGWARAKMNSDFQDLGEDDFTFDLAGGVGYSFNDAFVMGIGAALVNLNGDTQFFPGPFFNWNVSETIRMGLYGPVFVVSYAPTPEWQFSLRSDTGGDTWNISDDNGDSRSIALSSYRIGIYAGRRLTENLWLRAGAGITVGNDIELTRPQGSRIAQEDMDGGLFGQISLRVLEW